MLVLMSINASILHMYNILMCHMKLQGPVSEQLWLNQATLGKYVENTFQKNIYKWII